MHALFVYGADANAGTCIQFSTQGQGVPGCGVFDASWLGNNYFGLGIHGYGNTGVHYNGSYYVLISSDVDAGKNTTPGTNNGVWYWVGFGPPYAAYPEWSNTTDYFITRPIYTSSGGYSTRSVFAGLYVEGSGISHLGGASMAWGGQIAFTSYSAHAYTGPYHAYTGPYGGTWIFGHGMAATLSFPDGTPGHASARAS
jgi:hypothetical protein